MTTGFRFRWAPLALLGLIGCAGTDVNGCSDHGGTTVNVPVTKSPQATAASLLPVPYDWATGTNQWRGTRAELMFADALASCLVFSTGDPTKGQYLDLPQTEDAYRNHVLNLMEETTCSAVPLQGTTVGTWATMRSKNECNRDPSTNLASTATLSAAASLPVTLKDLGTDPLKPDPVVAAAYGDLLAPAVNLCVAQRLREIAPGAAGAEALLLSEAEQRELLAMTLERAQRAMIGYAVLGLLFTAPSAGAPPNPLPLAARSYVLWSWANGPAASQPLHSLGGDFATATQLHAILAEETATFFSRTASAREPRGGNPSGPIEEAWGPGSWRQRTLAVLYGGQALAIDAANDPTAPWSPPLGYETPFLEGENWPTRSEVPYPRYPVPEPQAHLFGTLASVLPSQSFVVAPDPDAAGCYRVDPAKTGPALYARLEHQLRKNNGLPSVNTTDLQAHLHEYLLWQQHGLTPDHATSYGRYLADLFDPICWSANKSNPSSGSINLHATIGWVDPGGDDGICPKCPVSPPAVTVYGKMEIEPKSLSETAPRFSRGVPWLMPESFRPLACASDQGLAIVKPKLADVSTSTYDRMAAMGATSALVATREALATISRSGSALAPSYGWASGSILRLIDAAVGAESVSLRRKVTYSNLTGSKGVCAGATQYFTGLPQWDVDVVVKDDDSFYKEDITLYAVPNDAWAANLARFPDRAAFGRTIGSVLSKAVSVPLVAASATADESKEHLARFRADQLLLDGGEAVNWTLIAASSKGVRLLLSGFNTRSVLDAGGQYLATGGTLGRIASTAFAKQRQNPAEPRFDGFGLETTWVPPTDAALFGGQVGEDAVSHYLALAKQTAEDATTAVETALQNLLQQQSDQAGIAVAAQRASEVNKIEETALCGSANDTCEQDLALGFAVLLTEDESDNWPPTGSCPQGLPQYDPTQIEDEVSKDEKRFVESINNAPCDESNPAIQKCEQDLGGALPTNLFDVSKMCVGLCPALKMAQQQLAGLQASASQGGTNLAPYITDQDRAAAHAIRCLAKRAVVPFSTNVTALPKVMIAVQDAQEPPPFGNFAGGSVQPILVEQWFAIRKLRDLAGAYMKATNAAVGTVFQARAVANSSTSLYAQSCNPDAAARALNAGTSSSSSSGSSSGVSFSFPPTISVGSSDSSGTSYSTSPALSYTQGCAQLAASASASIAAVDAQQKNAIASLASFALQFDGARRDVAVANAQLASLVEQTHLAKARNNLEAQLTASSATTSFGLYRRFHDLDLFRAKALVESARRYAVVARRAVESRFAVNLSAMSGAEPFVEAPSLWADEIYAQDLSLPAAVGLTAGAGAGSANANANGIYPNKIRDYVGNLEAFVTGFAVARPSASAHDDTEVVALPGPYAKKKWAGPQFPGASSAFVPADAASRWELYCPDTNDWRGVIAVPLVGSGLIPEPAWTVNPCDKAQPTLARTSFILSPWGQLDGTPADTPYEARYNARWTHFAVNLTGTGVLDCTKAIDPPTCYSQSFVRYSLTHVGPAWVTDFDGNWRSIEMGNAFIEGGKALSAEQLWDPVQTTWTAPGVSPLVRDELIERPLGGSYTLIVQLAPEIRLDRVERIQLLIGTSYWVKQ